MSKSQVFMAYSFWVICRNVSRAFVELCVQFWYRNMAGRNQQNHLEFTFSIRAISFHSRASISAHKHIFYYEERLNCWKSGGETFYQRDSIPSLVSRTVKTRKFKLLYFRNETCYGTGNLYKDLFFVYLQSRVNKNFVKPPYFDFIIWWRVTVKYRSKYIAFRDDQLIILKA